MAIPGRQVRIAVLPQTVEASASIKAVLYIANERLGGMKSMAELKQGAFVYVRDIGPHDKLQDLSVTNGTRTETIQHSPLAGGLINGWRTQDTGIDVAWGNYPGFAGSGISQAVFIHDEVNAFSNPTLGGSYHNDFPSGGCGNLTYGTGFSGADIIMQGSHAVSLSSSGTTHSVTVYPLEWDVDGGCAAGALDHGGNAHNAIIWPTIKMTMSMEVNWDSNVGIHRVGASMVMPTDLPINMRCAWVPIGLQAIFGWDEVIAYDTDTTTYTTMQGVVAYTGLASPALSDVSASDPVVTITFSSTHGRTVATRHQVTVSGASGGGASINGTHSALFDTSTTCTLSIAGASGTYTGASVTSPTVHLADVDNSQLRLGLGDTMQIVSGAFISDDEQGSFPGKQPHTGGRGALIYRATGVNSWSTDNDFALGLYCESLSSGANHDDRRQVSWKSARSGSTPDGGVRDTETMRFTYNREWTIFRSKIMAAGLYTQNAYILTGTYVGVQGLITTLDAESDAALW